MNFYENLEKQLNTRKITVYRLCKDLDISTNTLGNYKKGTVPKIDIVEKIALYLGISTDALIIGEKQISFDEKLTCAYHAASPERQEMVRDMLHLKADQAELSISKIG